MAVAGWLLAGWLAGWLAGRQVAQSVVAATGDTLHDVGGRRRTRALLRRGFCRFGRAGAAR